MPTNHYLRFLTEPTFEAETVYIDQPDDPPSCLIRLTVNFTRPEFRTLCTSDSEPDDLEIIDHQEERSSFTESLSLPEDWFADLNASLAALEELLAGVGVPPRATRSELAMDIFAAIVYRGERRGVGTSLPRGDGLEGLERGRRGKVVTCSVSLEDIPVGSESTRLPCWHWYHEDCILKWLEESNTCSLCRFEMT